MAAKTKAAPKKSTKVGIRPLGERMLVQRVEAEAKSAGGILLPESAKDKPKEGKIVACGEGKILDDGSRLAMNVKVGDRVLFTAYGGTDVKFNDTDYLIMHESDILGVIG